MRPIEPRIPYGAHPIIRAIEEGNPPQELVLISMVGALREGNPTVEVQHYHPPARYRWDWVQGLWLMLVVQAEQSRCVVDYAAHLLLREPAGLNLWVADGGNGEGVGYELFHEQRPQWVETVGDGIEVTLLRSRAISVRRMGVMEGLDYQGLGYGVSLDEWVANRVRKRLETCA